MNTVSQTTSPSIPGASIGVICFSRAILEGLHAEIQKPDLSRHKSQSEAVGLLFGTVDSVSVRVENLEPVTVDDLGRAILLAGERLHKALGERISAVRSGSVQSPTLIGWYVSQSDHDTGLLDRVISIHNRFFRNDHDVAVILKREAKGHFAVEVYAAKQDGPLLKSNHRVGSWHSANLNGWPEQANVMLADRAHDELFLNVYRTDQAESEGNWERIRKYTARLIPTFGKTARAGQDSLFSNTPYISPVTNGSGLGRGSEWTPDSGAASAAALSPQKRLSSLPELQTWLPESAATAPIAEKKKMGFLRTAAWLLATIVISVLTYIAAHLYLKPMLLNLTGQTSTGAVAASPKAAAPQTVFGLKVSQNGTALELQWNPLYPPIQHAASGKLVINDGTSTREIEIDQTQLRSGRIVYIPTSGDVRFSLKVMDSPSHTVTDSIRVLASPSEKTSGGSRRYEGEQKTIPRDAKGVPIVAHPGSAVVQPGSSKSQTRASTSFSTDAENRPAGSPEDVSAPLIVPSVSSVPQFDILPGLPTSPSPPTKPISNPDRAVHKEAGSGVPRQALPLANHPRNDPKIAPGLTDRKVPLATPPETAREQAPGSSSLLPVQQRAFTPPVALYRQFPTLLHGVLFSNVVVPVIVHISETGQITSVALAPSDSKVRPDISKEALAAARKWRFSPAKLGEKAVSSEMRINFVFRPSQPNDGIAP